MGWANCGTDSKGRRIGYANPGTCDQPGCHCKIDRGLSYACGDMHGQNEHDCEGYFCVKHLTFVTMPNGKLLQLCLSCAGAYDKARRAEAGCICDHCLVEEHSPDGCVFEGCDCTAKGGATM